MIHIPRTVEEEDYFIVLPHIDITGVKERYSNNPRVNFEEFTSENTRMMGDEELKQVLLEDGWLEELKDVGFLGKVESQDVKFKDKKWL